MCDGESSSWSLILHPELNHLANEYDYLSHHLEGWKTGHRVADHVGTRGAILLGHRYRKMYRVMAPSLWTAALPLHSCMCVAFAITGWVVNRNNNYNCAETARIKLQILPNAAFPFSPSGFTIWISQTVHCYFWAYPSFYFLVFFLFLHFFSCRFRAVDWADLCRLSSVS